MKTKPDGRLYSRITRRSKTIIGGIRKDREFTINEIAQQVHSKNLKEFYLQRFKRRMSLERLRDYVRFLADLEIIISQGDKYVLNFQHGKRDEDWAQALSDKALQYLGKTLNKPVGEIPGLLENTRSTFLEARRIPTLDALVVELGIEGGRSQEVAKWALYMYTDGETCNFDIRRYPVFVLTRVGMKGKGG